MVIFSTVLESLAQAGFSPEVSSASLHFKVSNLAEAIGLCPGPIMRWVINSLFTRVHTGGRLSRRNR